MDTLEQLEACRICVTCFPIQEMDFINIFEKNEEFQQELDFIQGEIQQWQLKIQPDDGLPQRICANCFTKFCSIEAFRRECEQGQQKLFETIIQQTANGAITEEKNKQLLKDNNGLPLVGNYDTATQVAIQGDPTVLVSSVTLNQNDVSLNDFPVFDQQFSHFDNSALMDDASATLLDSNHLSLAAETSNDLGFLPSQNLFTFETAEPPSTGTTLPLDETDTTSIMSDLLVEAGTTAKEQTIKQEDLEDMLKHSIIPTTTKLNLNKTDESEQPAATVLPETQDIKANMGNQYKVNFNTKGNNVFPNTTPISTLLSNRDDNLSDNECDESHINARLKGLSYACHYCFCPDNGYIDHLVFPNEDALSQHFFDIHDPNRPYTCPQCAQSYKTQLLRDNHVRVLHNITESQTCSFCHKLLSGSMEVHQYNCPYIGDWECEQCKEKFLRTPLFRFRLHQRQHERTKNLQCRLCDRTFLRKANLEAHQRMHKTDVRCKFPCDVCQAKFIDDYELKRHKYQKHSGELPVKCKICHKGFSTAAFLQRHLKLLHPDHNTNKANKSTSPSTTTDPQHICLNCSSIFKSIHKLQNHLILGRDKNGNCLSNSCSKLERRKLLRQGVFPCFHCPRRFHLRSQLDKHLNTHDARLRPFQCQQCYVRCRTAVELKQHVNVAHLNIKAFSCEKCGKCFGYKKDLRDHMLFHAEINVHCTEEGCDYVCNNDKALNDHIRHKHRLLSCEYCKEQFTRQKLTAHLRNVHREEIDVELATESDNYYKSQLLNNNNDINQISFNLLNTQTQKTTNSPTLTTLTTSALNKSKLKISSIITSPTSSTTTSSSLASCLTHPKGKSSTLTASSGLINVENNVVNPHQQLCSMFANDPNDSHTTLALNGLVTTENDLNLIANDTSSMYLVPSSTSSTNDNNLDQYFMASLMDTEQEIIVT